MQVDSFTWILLPKFSSFFKKIKDNSWHSLFEPVLVNVPLVQNCQGTVPSLLLLFHLFTHYCVFMCCLLADFGTFPHQVLSINIYQSVFLHMPMRINVFFFTLSLSKLQYLMKVWGENGRVWEPQNLCFLQMMFFRPWPSASSEWPAAQCDGAEIRVGSIKPEVIPFK